MLALQALPERGNAATLGLVKAAQEELVLSPAESEAIELRQDGNSVHWDADKDPHKTCAFRVSVLDMLLGQFAKMDSSGNLTLKTLALWDRLKQAKEEADKE